MIVIDIEHVFLVVGVYALLLLTTAAVLAAVALPIALVFQFTRSHRGPR